MANSSSSSVWFDLLKSAVAVAVLAAFFWILCHLLGQTKAGETEWTRAVYLFQGVEAVAFAAAGFFFGKEVHRQRAEKAESRAAKSEKQAAKGEALAAAVKSKAHAHPAKAAAFRTSSTSAGPAFDAHRADLDELAELARELLP